MQYICKFNLLLVHHVNALRCVCVCVACCGSRWWWWWCLSIFNSWLALPPWIMEKFNIGKEQERRNCVQPSRTTWRHLGRPLHSTWWEQSPPHYISAALCSLCVDLTICVVFMARTDINFVLKSKLPFLWDIELPCFFCNLPGLIRAVVFIVRSLGYIIRTEMYNLIAKLITMLQGKNERSLGC